MFRATRATSAREPQAKRARVDGGVTRRKCCRSTISGNSMTTRPDKDAGRTRCRGDGSERPVEPTPAPTEVRAAVPWRRARQVWDGRFARQWQHTVGQHDATTSSAAKPQASHGQAEDGPDPSERPPAGVAWPGTGTTSPRSWPDR
jgi:hypothetical protein